MNWFSSAARMGTVLRLALFFFVSVPVVTSPCYGQTGTLPNNAQGINDNYDALKEGHRSDRTVPGRHRRRRYSERPTRCVGTCVSTRKDAKLENVATGIEKKDKDSQMVEKISKLKDRVTGILDSNKVALRSGASSRRSLQLRRRGRRRGRREA